MKQNRRVWPWLVIALVLVVALRLLSEGVRGPTGEREATTTPSTEGGPDAQMLSTPTPDARNVAANPAPTTPEATASEDTPGSAESVVTGRIVVTEGHARDVVEVHLVPEWPTKLRGLFDFEFTDDGVFRFGALAAGTYGLEVQFFGGLPGTHAIRGIAVGEGETVTLEPIVLEDVKQLVRLDVRDERGSRIQDAVVCWLTDGMTEEWILVSCPSDEEGRLLFRTLGRPPERLRIEARGFLATEITSPRADESVVLVPGPRLYLRLHGGLPRLREPWQLFLRIKENEKLEPELARVDSDGNATLPLSRPGRFYVGLWLQDPNEIGRHSLSGLDWWIEVEPTSAEQSFTSPPFTAEFLDNLERLTRGP